MKTDDKSHSKIPANVQIENESLSFPLSRRQSKLEGSHSIKDRERIILCGPKSGVNYAAFTKDYLLSAGEDSNILRWNYRSGELLQVYKGHNAAVTCIATIPNENLFATSSLDGTVRIWSINSGNSIVILDTKDIFSNRMHIPISSLAVSPSGQELFICGHEPLPIFTYSFEQNRFSQLPGRLGGGSLKQTLVINMSPLAVDYLLQYLLTQNS